jgi:hypothetical protein
VDAAVFQHIDEGETRELRAWSVLNLRPAVVGDRFFLALEMPLRLITRRVANMLTATTTAERYTTGRGACPAVSSLYVLSAGGAPAGYSISRELWDSLLLPCAADLDQ